MNIEVNEYEASQIVTALQMGIKSLEEEKYDDSILEYSRTRAVNDLNRLIDKFKYE